MVYEGKTYLEMDDEQGYPHCRKPPNGFPENFMVYHNPSHQNNIFFGIPWANGIPSIQTHPYTLPLWSFITYML